MDPSPESEPAGLEQVDSTTWRCHGRWTVDGLGRLTRELGLRTFPGAGKLVLQGGGVQAMDTAGAWLLRSLLERLDAQGRQVETEGFPEHHMDLLARLDELAEPAAPAPPKPLRGVYRIGKASLDVLQELFELLSFAGETFVCLLRALARPWRIRWKAVLADMETAGMRALGIVGLLSFLMGVVIAYQGAVQLRAYGANIYVADLVGLSMLRELSPLLAAIIVAGRTGSAYTAQIGTMQVTEEVAALRTIGISPFEVLVLPKVISLCLALPLLTVFADVMGVLGGMVMAKLQLGLGFVPFLDRLNEAVGLRSFLLGLGKAPVFALIVVLIGCFQGFKVSGSAASVGHHTTLSVVQSIFLVIVADAWFSVMFSWLNI
ncbi:ABC transporter permease [Thiohalobacter thiocyanaticus]|uniref:MlaE family lipid ABC transporter permease subunit n=1 Tax=Thiohalobacter thiocyanaticus TaxID=585455 RepID=A0A426QH59_9GAMM|nr:MlaE family lipid ABC transporter permease subunit [Thiohalobacter thiocyanaticus]RRQ21098.1 MlaE family lipid ABC transporter permease subunit [Thiohalobacter thiocyanaticus]